MWIKGGEPSGQKTHKLVYLENFDKAPTQQYNMLAWNRKPKGISHVACADAKEAAAWVTPSVNKNQLASIGKCICWHDILSFLKIMKYKLNEKDSWYVYNRWRGKNIFFLAIHQWSSWVSWSQTHHSFSVKCLWNVQIQILNLPKRPS